MIMLVLFGQEGWDRPLLSPFLNHLAGLVVKASASRAENPGFESRLRRDFSGASHTSDLKIGTPVATLPGTWDYRVSAGTCRPGVSILWLGEVESLTCNFCLRVAAHTIVQIRPWDTLSCCWDVKHPTNQRTSFLLVSFPFSVSLLVSLSVDLCHSCLRLPSPLPHSLHSSPTLNLFNLIRPLTFTAIVC